MLHASPTSVAALRLNVPLAPGAARRCQALWLCYTLTLIYTCFRASRSSTLLQDGYYRNAKVVFGQSCPMPQCTIHGLYQCRNQIWLIQPGLAVATQLLYIAIYTIKSPIYFVTCFRHPSNKQQVAIQVQNIHYDILQSNKSKVNKELKMRKKNIKKCEKKC